jgi:Ubiquinone biosynthesis protein COQ7
MQQASTWSDRLIATLDEGLRALGGSAVAARPSPADTIFEDDLAAAERQTSAALLRVNHAGELAAQGLYGGQALLARTSATRAHLRAAAREEGDHLAWCAARLDELGGRASVLSPFWEAFASVCWPPASATSRVSASSPRRNAKSRRTWTITCAACPRTITKAAQSSNAWPPTNLITARWRASPAARSSHCPCACAWGSGAGYSGDSRRSCDPCHNLST